MKRKNNLGIIGRVADGVDLFDGQTVLTRMFRDELKKHIKDVNVICVDTYNYKKNMIKCFFKTIYCLFVSKNIFILLSENGLSFYLPFLYHINKFFKRNIYHRVIGGNLDKMIKSHPKWPKYLRNLTCNYVEMNSLANSLKKLDIKNVKVSPNFKRLESLKREELKKYTKLDEIRFCTFSRVAKEKGIGDAIDSINKYNNKNKKKIYLDIYGPIEDNYNDEFFRKIKDNKYILYKGIISSLGSVDILKNYYMLLFPTYWKGEGFPGTLIDAFHSGLPVIATNWNANAEIIQDNVTGMIYDYQNKELLLDKISYCVSNIDKVNKMRLNCLNESLKYNPEDIIGKLVADMRKKDSQL